MPFVRLTVWFVRGVLPLDDCQCLLSFIEFLRTWLKATQWDNLRPPALPSPIMKALGLLCGDTLCELRNIEVRILEYGRQE